MLEEKWISVYQYCKKYNKKKQNVYLDLRTGKIPKEKWRKAKIEVIRIQILDN